MPSAEIRAMALAQYQYPVDLTRFTGVQEHPGWFNLNIEPEDRLQTMRFEARFRKQARHHLKAWGEVVFWKLCTTGSARKKLTQQVLDSKVPPDTLWSACTDYIESGSMESFKALRNRLFRNTGVATTATFPAFICPERFPMVDRQVTRWANENGHLHRYSGGSPQAVDSKSRHRCGPLPRSNLSGRTL